MQIRKQSPEALNKAVSLLKKGGVVICPTDTVYGFLADATNKKAVEKIYNIKKRPRKKPLPVFVSNMKIAKEFAEISKDQEKIIKKYWPGKHTFILNRKLGKKLYGQDKRTIALRIPRYSFLNNLLKRVNRPLVQTSVNVSTQSPLFSIRDIINEFSRADILTIDAGTFKKSKPSKVVSLIDSKAKILRK